MNKRIRNKLKKYELGSILKYLSPERVIIRHAGRIAVIDTPLSISTESRVPYADDEAIEHSVTILFNSIAVHELINQ